MIIKLLETQMLKDCKYAYFEIFKILMNTKTQILKEPSLNRQFSLLKCFNSIRSLNLSILETEKV